MPWHSRLHQRSRLPVSWSRSQRSVVARSPSLQNPRASPRDREPLSLLLSRLVCYISRTMNYDFGHGRFRAPIAVGAALLALGLSTSASFGSAPNLPVVNGKHVFWGIGAASPSSTNNLIYHGGLAETTPSTYVVLWGPTWQSGISFSAQCFTYTQG